MGELLAFVQVVIGAATLIVTVLALKRENPPGSGGNSKNNDEG